MTLRPVLFALGAALLLTAPAYADGPSAATVESDAAQHFAPRNAAATPMAQQITKNLNGDEDIPPSARATQTKSNAIMKKRNQAYTAQMYNHNDEDIVAPAGARSTFSGPHSPTVKGTATSPSYN